MKGGSPHFIQMTFLSPVQCTKNMVRNKSFALEKLTVWKLGLLLKSETMKK